jgi:hypothetical protein
MFVALEAARHGSSIVPHVFEPRVADAHGALDLARIDRIRARGTAALLRLKNMEPGRSETESLADGELLHDGRVLNAVETLILLVESGALDAAGIGPRSHAMRAIRRFLKRTGHVVSQSSTVLSADSARTASRR